MFPYENVLVSMDTKAAMVNFSSVVYDKKIRKIMVFDECVIDYVFLVLT